MREHAVGESVQSKRPLAGSRFSLGRKTVGQADAQPKEEDSENIGQEHTASH